LWGTAPSFIQNSFAKVSSKTYLPIGQWLAQLIRVACQSIFSRGSITQQKGQEPHRISFQVCAFPALGPHQTHQTHHPPPHCANSPSHYPQHNPHSVQSAPKFSSSRTTPVPPPSPSRPRQSQSQFDQHPTTPTPSTNYLLDNITGCFTDPKHLDSFLSFPLEYVIVGLDITIFQPTLPLSVFLTPSRTAES